MRYEELLPSNPKNPPWAQGIGHRRCCLERTSENLTMHFATSGQAIQVLFPGK